MLINNDEINFCVIVKKSIKNGKSVKECENKKNRKRKRKIKRKRKRKRKKKTDKSLTMMLMHPLLLPTDAMLHQI